MRKLYFMAVLAFSVAAQAKVVYVAPDGNDAGSGSIDSPLATLAAAQQLLAPGDTAYFRGGTYHITEDQVMGVEEKIYATVFNLNKSGREGARIVYAGMPGERPVFDLTAVKPEGLRVSVFYIHANWLHLKNFDIVGTQVTITGHTQSEAISIRRGNSHNVIENVAIHDGMAIGVYITKGSDNLVLNCDAYRNYDSVSEGGRGGNVDGFGCHVRRQDTGNVFRGCRAWCNSDDGYDLINCFAPVTFDHCWAMFSGYRDEDSKTPGDGNGFKAGGYGKQVQDEPFDAPRHTVNNCIAYSNKANGFYANHHLGGNDWLNNTAWKNKYNYCMVNQKAWDEAVDVDGYGHKLRSNVSYQANRGDWTQIDRSRCTIENNSFLPTACVVQPSDFVSTDYRELMAPRKADGSLPDTDFLRLSPSSPLHGAGMGWQFAPGEGPSAIYGVTAGPSPVAEGHIYTLQGVRVDAPSKGIYIKGGRKVVVR